MCRRYESWVFFSALRSACVKAKIPAPTRRARMPSARQRLRSIRDGTGENGGGAAYWNRTSDPQLRRLLLYPTELTPPHAACVQSQVCTVQPALTLRCALGDIIPAAARLRTKMLDCMPAACMPRRPRRLAGGRAREPGGPPCPSACLRAAAGRRTSTYTEYSQQVRKIILSPRAPARLPLNSGHREELSVQTVFRPFIGDKRCIIWTAGNLQGY